MMSGDRLQAAGEIGNCDRGCAALPVKKKTKTAFEGVNLDELAQRGEHCGIASPAHQSRGKGPNLPFSMSDSNRPYRSERRVLHQITPREPVAPRLTILAERARKAVPSKNPLPAAIGDRDADLWPTIDRRFCPPPGSHGHSECLVGPLQKRAIEVEAVFVEVPLRHSARLDPSRRPVMQHPRQRDFVRSRGQHVRERQPPQRKLIPMPPGQNRLNEGERGPQQSSNVVPPAAGYADGGRSDLLQSAGEEPRVRRDIFRRSANRANGGADRRRDLLPSAFGQVAGL